VIERVDIHEDGADELVPIFSGDYVGAGSSDVVSAESIIQDDGLGVVTVAEVGVKFELGGTTGELFDRGIDEPDSDVVPRAGPSVGGGLVLHARVAVLVLDGVLVNSRVHNKGVGTTSVGCHLWGAR